MNLQLKNLKLLSPTSADCLTSPTKLSMCINTDTQKALEHLRELANNPSELEHVQTLKNHPNLIQKIKKVANQSFSDQLKALPPFTPSINKLVNQENLEQNSTVTPLVNNLSLPNSQHSICCTDCPSKTSTLSHLRFQNRIDVDCETESNHDTALTLSCAGGHEELVTLLLQRGANIEHRDKKGFTPLILAGLLLVFW